MPDNQIIQSILATFGKPLLSTSIAYPSQQDYTQMWQVVPHIPPAVTTVIDDGEDLKPPGTVVSYLTNEFRVIREGELRFSI